MRCLIVKDLVVILFVKRVANVMLFYIWLQKVKRLKLICFYECINLKRFNKAINIALYFLTEVIEDLD